MSDDIVTKLEFLLQEGAEIVKEQAAEIERLREERDKFYHLARRLYNQHGKRGDEVLAEAYLLKEYEKAVEF